MDEPKPQVKLEVVEATMSSPMLHAGMDESAVVPDIVVEVLEPTGSPELPRIVVAREVEVRIEVVIVIAVAIAGSVVAADGRVGIVVGSFGLAAIAARRADRRVPFSFGEGFLGYRGDPEWPRGVQEDDDVHWNWQATATPGRRP